MEQENTIIAKRINILDYITIFNFISKVVYYRTNGSATPLGSLRKECCSDMIEHDSNIATIIDILNDMNYGFKFTDMYTKKINDKCALSIIITKIESKIDNEFISMVCTNDIIFDDDLRHIYVLIDNRLFDSDHPSSCADYIEILLNNIISNLVNPASNMKKLNILLSNILYSDGIKYKNNKHVTKTINLYIDKIMKNCMDNNVDYIAFSTLFIEELRGTFADYIYDLDEE